MTTKELRDMIRRDGVDKVFFSVPMRPTHTFMGLIGFTTSSDDYVEVPCCIDTSRYDPLEGEFGYKITMKSMVKGFSYEHFYLTDFIQLINNGTVKIRGFC